MSGLAAAAAATIAALFVSGPVTASGAPSGTPASVQISATARHVFFSRLPKAGAVHQRRALPNLRPNRTGTSTTLKAPSTAAAAAPQAVAPGSTGFVGDSFTQQNNVYTSGDQALVPPDNGTAANAQYVVEFLNSSGWVYLRNNGASGPIATSDLNSMFVSSTDTAGCNASPQPTSPCFVVSDPRVVWDPTDGRWFASILALDLYSNASKEYVAVSDNWDATMGWTVNTVWSSTTFLGDQPRMGVTSDKVVVFWDDWDSTPSFIQEDGVAVTKAALEAGSNLTSANSHEFTPNTGQFGVVPAWDSSTSDTWAVWNDTDDSLTMPTFHADGKVHLIHITGTASSPTLTETSYSPHAGSTGGGTGMSAPQQGPTAGTSGGPAINTDDDRVNVTAFDGRNLVSTANTTCTVGTSANLVCVRVFRINIASGTPTYVGDANIGTAGKYVYYGAPALDGAGNLAVVMSESDASSMWPSSAISGATAGSPLTFSAPAVINAGQAMYNEVGFVQECVAGVFTCRWGDYAGAQPDPCDPNFVWTSSEFADNNTTSDANWSTWIAPVTFGAGRVPASCAGAPTITSLTPSCGNSGTSVVIAGTGFTNIGNVYFGSVPASSFTVDNAGQITATAPSQTSGANSVDVSVVSGGGDSALTPADKFSYVGSNVPTVTGVSPDTAPADGLTAESVTVSGTNFVYPVTVQFGSAGSQIVDSGACSSLTVLSPASGTAQAVDVTVQDSNGTSSTSAADKFYYTDGGYTMDAYGLVHPYGNVQAPPARTDGPNWTGWKIARGVALRSDRGSGYVLDGWGGVHAFGGATPIADNTHAYWPGWDIARAIALDPCDSTGSSGYVLDGWGGVHAFGPHAQTVTQSANSYFFGFDIARSIVLNSCATGGGYVLDGYGGVHPFATGSSGMPGVPNLSAYWNGWDIARDITLTGDGMGYVLDGWGGLHEFGGASPIANGSHAYWQGWDIARGVTGVPGVTGGYILDGWGGVHEFGGAPAVTFTGYSSGNDIFRGIR